MYPTSSLLVFLLNVFQVTPAAEYLLYRFHRDSVAQYLSDHHLVYHYTLSPTTLITDLITRVIDDMSTSPSLYRFASSSLENNMFLSHETQPLQLLGLVNKGTPRVSDNQVHLRTMPVTRSTTLQHLADDKAFANAAECIEDGRFVIYFGECVVCDQSSPLTHFMTAARHHPISAVTSFDGGIGRHLCISERFYSIFYSDSTNGSGPSISPSCIEGCGASTADRAPSHAVSLRLDSMIVAQVD